MTSPVDDLVSWLEEQRDCVLESGLSESELDQAEATFHLRFPPLWRQVLSRVLPVERPGIRQNTRAWASWPDWRLRNVEQDRARVDAPVDGLLFDVERSDFWWTAWGPRPLRPDQRLSLARDRLANVPTLVPIRGHQYVGEAPRSPVFSIVQADLYIPAVTLADLATGRNQDAVPISDWPIGRVEFWSELHAYSQAGHFDDRFATLGQGGL